MVMLRANLAELYNIETKKMDKLKLERVKS